MLNGDWGLGIGDWGLGPNPQSPIPNPQSPIPITLNSKDKQLNDLYVYDISKLK